MRRDPIARTNENGVTSKFDLKQCVELAKLSRQVHDDSKLLGQLWTDLCQTMITPKPLLREQIQLRAGWWRRFSSLLTTIQDNNNAPEGPPTSDDDENAGTEEDSSPTMGSWLTLFFAPVQCNSNMTWSIK
jgi:hypothetical protein